MKSLQRNISIFFICISAFISCSAPGAEVEITNGSAIYIKKGTADFLTDLAELKNPRGVIPSILEMAATTDLLVIEDGWIHSSSTASQPVDPGYKEFFAFDNNTTLIILSSYPLYYLKIKSDEFYNHFSNEFVQLQSGKFGLYKAASSSCFYKTVSDYSIEVYFTPNEIGYNNDNDGVNRYRICVLNENDYLDPWRLAAASWRNVFYTPLLEQPKIYQDLMEGTYLKGQNNVIFANGSDLTSQGESLYNKTNSFMNFSFMYGENLKVVEEIIPSDAPGVLVQDDYNEMTRDYLVFYTQRLGNDYNIHNSSWLNDTNFLNKNDGIAVVIRGHDLSVFKKFLQAEGIDFSSSGGTEPWLNLKDNNDSKIEVKWFANKSNLKLYYAKEDQSNIGNPEAYGSPITVSGTSYQLPVARGYRYFIKLTDTDDKLIGEDSLLLPTNELAFTEIMFSGSTYNTNDKWFEVKNISGAKIDLSTVTFWQVKTYDEKYDNRAGMTNGLTSSLSVYTPALFPLEEILLPDEYAVIAEYGTDSDYFFKEYFNSIVALQHFNANTALYFGTTTYYMELRYSDGRVIASAKRWYREGIGAYKLGLRQSAVLDKDGTWRTSTNNSGISSLVDVDWDNGSTTTGTEQTNICSPGFAAADEY